MPHTIYLDSNATTHVLPAAVAAATRAMAEQFGNPSSSHSDGLVAKDLLEQTRASAKEILGAGDGHVVFTSGATEGIQTAVLSALRAIGPRRAGQGGQLVVYGATEHKAVPHALEHWNSVLGLGLEIRALPVHADGQHDLALLAAWLPEVALLCTMAANNETGVVSNLTAIQKVLTQANSKALWLVDGVQALGKLDLDLHNSRIDYAPFSGHKLYAPKGIGMLYVRRGAPFTPLLAGGGQEGGLRGGTENVPGIAALGAVLQALQRGNTFASHTALRGYRDQLEHCLRNAFPAIALNTPLEHSLPTTLNFSVPGISSKTLLDVFDAAGLRVSAGSACSAAKSAPSEVLDAMGLSAWRATSAVRLSIGPLANSQLVAAACVAIARCGPLLQSMAEADARVPGHVSACGPTDPLATLGSASSDEAATALMLHWSELEAFLERNPDARLVDVREAAEHLASGGLHCGARSAINLPLSTITGQRLALNTPAMPSTPMVLVCRSGKRSLQAALCLRSLGHQQVRHVYGGLALRPVAADACE